jgi:hypothetical protein
MLAKKYIGLLFITQFKVQTQKPWYDDWRNRFFMSNVYSLRFIGASKVAFD